MTIKRCRYLIGLLFGAGLLCLFIGIDSYAKVPRSFMGTIIVSDRDELDLQGQNVMGRLKQQDRSIVGRNADNRWTLHMVAFFKQPLPVSKMMVVVVDQKKEAVAVAEVRGSVGQDSLACSLVVESTEYPGKKHTLKVLYMHQGKPVVLAQKTIVLK